MRTWVVLAALLVASLLPLANAQSASASSKVTITGLGNATALKSGATAAIPFKVAFEASGFGCPQGGSFTVALSVTGLDNPKNVTGAFDKTNLTFAVPAGVYGDTGGMVPGTPVGSYTATADGTLHVTAGNLTQNATGKATVTADFKGGSPPGCNGSPAGDVPAAKDSKDAPLTFTGNPPPPPPVIAPKKKGLLPAPDAVLTIGAALVALAFAAQKRRS
ncbi:MAG: hypothetical protein ACYDCK_12990 [Thermoplasmatota archaeon]